MSVHLQERLKYGKPFNKLDQIAPKKSKPYFKIMVDIPFLS